MNTKTNINDSNIKPALQVVFILFMSIYISIGHLAEYIDCFETNEIEQAEEKDIESEEKENKEELEKDEFLKNLFFCNFTNRLKLLALHSANTNWDNPHGEIPTPPPKS